MLTNDEIKQSQQLTEEYGDGRDHERRYPDPSSIFKAMEQRHEQRRLESTLATTFIAQQKESIPAERTRLWNECLRLADEIERLNDKTPSND